MVDSNQNPWLVDPADFPQNGSNIEKLRFLVNYAVLAPSGHNTQPWLFKISDSEIWLYADRVRELPVADPEHRELIISCGAALFNLRSAIRHFGYLDNVQILPDARNASLIAIVRLGSPHQPSECENLLFSAITRRRTNRMHFYQRQILQTLLQEISNEAAEEGVSVNIMSKEQRTSIADLITEADVSQWSDIEFRHELAEWVRPGSNSSDGIPGYALGFGGLLARLAPLLIRSLNIGNGQATRDRKLVAQSPVITVMETKGDAPEDWVAAGQALERVLLRARADQVWASYLNQAIQVPETRERLRRSIGLSGYPQLLLRLGYGSDVRPTPRRPLAEVVR